MTSHPVANRKDAQTKMSIDAMMSEAEEKKESKKRKAKSEWEEFCAAQREAARGKMAMSS